MRTTALLYPLLIVFAETACAPLEAREFSAASLAELSEAVKSAGAGDTILLAGGQHRGGNYIEGLKGEPGKLIVIKSKDPGKPAVFSGGSVAFKLSRSSYFMLENIVVEKAELNNFQFDFSHHFILKNCVSRDVAGKGNHDGVKMPGCDNYLFYACRISDWGQNGSAVDMVGCREGLFVKCRVSFSDLPRDASANGLQAKGGSYHIGYYRNVFETADHRAIQFGGSTGREFFHQNNAEKGWEGFEQVAMGNAFNGCTSSIAFVSCTRCVAAYNTLIDVKGQFIRVLKEGGRHKTADNSFSHNLVVGEARVWPGENTDVASFRFDRNYWSPKVPELRVKLTGSAGGPLKLDSEGKPAPNHPAAAYGAHAEGLKKAWEEHVDKFQWAWEWARKLEEKGRSASRR